MTDLIIIPPVATILSMLKLFIIPVGGGIPAGVILAQAKGVDWSFVTLLYLVSDILLAIAFEPVLRLVARRCARVPALARAGALVKQATARSVAAYGGTGAGPLSLVLIAFGVDPMTGRASAHAAGHGFMAGWTIAIVGDMLYFGAIAITTLQLNSYISDPETTMMVVLAAMIVVPVLVRRMHSRLDAPVPVFVKEGKDVV